MTVIKTAILAVFVNILSMDLTPLSFRNCGLMMTGATRVFRLSSRMTCVIQTYGTEWQLLVFRLVCLIVYQPFMAVRTTCLYLAQILVSPVRDLERYGPKHSCRALMAALTCFFAGLFQESAFLGTHKTLPIKLGNRLSLKDDPVYKARLPMTVNATHILMT